jgi:hypothetical protein
MKRALTAVAVALGATPISAYELANHPTPTWHRVRRHGWEFRSERRRGASVRARCRRRIGRVHVGASESRGSNRLSHLLYPVWGWRVARGCDVRKGRRYIYETQMEARAYSRGFVHPGPPRMCAFRRACLRSSDRRDHGQACCGRHRRCALAWELDQDRGRKQQRVLPRRDSPHRR